MTGNAKVLDFGTLEEVVQKLGIDNPVSELDGIKFPSEKMVIADPCQTEPDVRYTLEVAPVEWVMRVYGVKGGNGRPSVLVLTPAGVEVDLKSVKWEAAPEEACNGHGAVDTGTVAVVDGAQVEKLLTADTKTSVESWAGKLPFGYFSATENGDGTFGVRVMRGENREIAAVKVVLP